MNVMPISEIIEKVTMICKKNNVKRLDLFSSFENKIGLGVGCFAFCKIGETFTESVIAVNKFVFHIFLYPPINTHFLYCQSQKYQFSLAFQSYFRHLLESYERYSDQKNGNS